MPFLLKAIKKMIGSGVSALLLLWYATFISRNPTSSVIGFADYEVITTASFATSEGF